GEDNRVLIGQSRRVVEIEITTGQYRHRNSKGRHSDLPAPSDGGCVPRLRTWWQLGRPCVALKPLQIGTEIRRVLIPEVSILLQTLQDDSLQFGGQVRIKPHRRDRCAIQNGLEN